MLARRTATRCLPHNLDMNNGGTRTIGVRRLSGRTGSLGRYRNRVLAVPVGLGLALGVVFASVSLGLVVRSAPRAVNLPADLGFDYAARSGLNFTRLRDGFIDQQLGEVSRSVPATLVGRDPPTSPGSIIDHRTVTTHTLTNDQMRDAYPITRVPFTAHTSDAAATRNGDPADCVAEGGTVWYRYTAAANIGLLGYTFGTDHAVTLGVFEMFPDGLRRPQCDTDANGSALVSFAATAGRTYYFQISSPLGGGKLVFSLDPRGTFQMASVSDAGDPGNDDSWAPMASGDGRYIVFASNALNIVPGAGGRCSLGSNAYPVGACFQIYLRDIARGTTRLVSASSTGTPANESSFMPYITQDGRYVGFESLATNLGDHPSDLEGQTFRRFVKDTRTGLVERIPSGSVLDHVGPQNAEAEGWDRITLSDDGRYVSFQTAEALAPDDINRAFDVYVYDRRTKRFEQQSVTSEGKQPTPTTQRATTPNNHSTEPDLSPSMSADGRYVVFRSDAVDLVPGDLNLTWDTFVRDRVTGMVERVSVSSEGVEGKGESGRQGFRARQRTISADGRFVVFDSRAPNLVPGDDNEAADTFVRDRATGTTTRITSSPSNAQVVHYPSISRDGRYVTFNVPSGDQPQCADTDGSANTCHFGYVHDRLAGADLAITASRAGQPAWGLVTGISDDGRTIAVLSSSPDLGGDTTNHEQVFVYRVARGI